MNPKNELPEMLFENQQAFEDWLALHHNTSPGIRLQLAKKGASLSSVSYDQALESALCYGWIDSQKEKKDEQSWLQRFTPRGVKSIWSKVNKEKAERLIESGRMKPSGSQAIEAAKKNGQWMNAYEPQSAASIPADFAVELDKNSKAKAFYDTLNRQNKYAITFRIQTVKKQETRAKRISDFIRMLENGEKIYP
ncbi:YdeI/OmpD-associated family protein [Paenibacillus roseipurpureus]|uniref:YdeI/OmpD-associated family protein n=1 Tax=Paenibacillus roseopurpureus TaxID=2918901 RepID=A0AA96RIB9_9BACL|nr:YdeI/OmpD-associated family protein [Paenibacillus sp. MBLB1832]WNR42094.1 YdeI/OmpD-associated family protein [Paenibacillus sp. MBLB1832]